ncbi:SPOR domain-containing protein [Isoalcanivorax indicus]|uniref:SPOR domain-containing protein n=1 Tax=Isoalcanivorax indicus TaxID=2202653 RepID=UPI000DBAA140|nr:SPOR domain-containing protein [Isoalcanivorax indicus]
MRWVFYSLLILNVIYLGWQLLGYTAAPAPPVVSRAAAPASLQLLEEAGHRAGAVRRADSPARGAMCVVAGPWGQRADAEALRAQAAEISPRGRVQPVTVRRDRLNWVYLPPQARREDALGALRELQSRGVDSFIVSEGEDANAVSLGYFSSEESARGLQVRMRDAGYPAEVRETWRETVEYWVYYPLLPDEAEARLAALVASGSGDAGVERAACR